MAVENIYEGLDSNILHGFDELVRPQISMSTYSINRGKLPLWMVIFNEYLTDNNKQIYIAHAQYYYKSSEIDNAYPKIEDGDILSPFNKGVNFNAFGIYFISTSTGVKIYEYAKSLCDASSQFVDKQSLAVALTENKSHKVKILRYGNNVFILSNQINEEFMNKALALFPYLFDIEELKTNQKIIDICKTVAKEQPIKDLLPDFLQKIEEMQNMKKFNNIKQALGVKQQTLIRKAEKNIENIRYEIDQLEQRLTRYYRDLEEYQLKHSVYTTQPPIDQKEFENIVNFLNKNKYITNYETRRQYSSYAGEHLDMPLLTIIAPITLYETEPLERYINAKLDLISPTSALAYTLKAFKKIFIDEEYKMICQTHVLINMLDEEIEASNSYLNYSITDFERLPQPHLTRFNCFGDNKRQIKEAIRNNDFCGAVATIIVATQNINFTDATVLRVFTEQITEDSRYFKLKSCISEEDGELYSIQDIVNKIIQEEPEDVNKPELTDTIG
jgi:hypothetical protein